MGFFVFIQQTFRYIYGRSREKKLDKMSRKSGGILSSSEDEDKFLGVMVKFYEKLRGESPKESKARNLKAEIRTLERASMIIQKFPGSQILSRDIELRANVLRSFQKPGRGIDLNLQMVTGFCLATLKEQRELRGEKPNWGDLGYRTIQALKKYLQRPKAGKEHKSYDWAKKNYQRYESMRRNPTIVQKGMRDLIKRKILGERLGEILPFPKAPSRPKTFLREIFDRTRSA